MKCITCGGFTEQLWKYCPNCGQNQLVGYGSCTMTGGQPGNAQGGIIGLTENAVPRRPGLKLDEHKVKVWTGAFMSFPHALEDVARKTIEGCGDPGHVLHGWKEVPDGFKRYTEAFGRHVLQEGKARDPIEAHEFMVTTTWNSLARLEHYHLDLERSCGAQANCQTQQKF